jgi:chemotaxis protein MotB
MSGGDFDDDHEEHVNHEAWVIPYADMLTLLMALFLMLFAISSVDLAKFEQLAAGLRSGNGGESAVLDGGESVFEGAGPAMVDPPSGPTREERAEQALRREEELNRAAALERRQLDQVEQVIREHATGAGIIDAVGFRRESRGLVVTIVADQVMFEPGQAAVRADGAAILEQVAVALRGMPNRVAVEGHTDDVPIGTAQFRSNWELSTARATEVLRHLIDRLGLPANRVSAAGYGDQRPVDTNATAEGRAKNRRVELAVLSEVATPAPG